MSDEDILKEKINNLSKMVDKKVEDELGPKETELEKAKKERIDSELELEEKKLDIEKKEESLREEELDNEREHSENNNNTTNSGTRNPFETTSNNSNTTGTNNNTSTKSETDILSTLTSPLIFLIISTFIWIFDWQILKFNRGGKEILIIGSIYLIFSLAYWLTQSIKNGISLSSKDDLRRSFQPFAIAIFISFLQSALPHFFLRFFPNYDGWLWLGMIFLAPWTFYFIFLDKNAEENTLIQKMRIGWILALIIIVLFFSAGTLIQSAVSIGTNTRLAVSPQESFQDFLDIVKGKAKDIRTSINETINAKLYPENAKSQIDKNSEARLGVFIDNVRPLSKNFFTNEDFEVIGEMETKTLFSEIRIKTYCFAENYNKEKTIGKSDYDEFFVQGASKEILQCQFPEGLAKGRYSIYFEANFNFETWAYLDYTFVDKQLARDYYREGKDINKDLDIDKEPIPIFTDGPAQILMIAANQPIEIDFEKEGVLPAFGIILDKNWQYGKIEKINRVVVQMPKMIELIGCSIATDKVEYLTHHPDTEESSDYFNYYVFTEPPEDIVCRMDIDEEMFKQEKGLAQKLVKTVVVSEIYEYSVPSRKENIRVEDMRI